MYATVVTIRNPFHPTLTRESVVLDAPLTVAACLQRCGLDASALPLICFYQGEPLLRAQWPTTRIQKDDIVVFATLPLGRRGGGGGKNPLRTVLSIAAMVVAAPLGGMVAGALGVSSALGTSLMTAGIAIGGAALVNVLIPPPRAHLPGAPAGPMGSLPAASPTYSVHAQGNHARLQQPIPVIYGRHRVFPDFAAAPYVVYKDNQQYLYQLHCIGQGLYEVENLCLGDTPLTSFDDVHYEIIPPNGTLTLFAPHVFTSGEVAGQDLPGISEPEVKKLIGPFIATPLGTEAIALEVDMIMPRGLYYANNNGGLDAKSVSWDIHARKIDAQGLPLGEWITLGRETVSDATATAQRRSYQYPVEKGRYEVRMLRTGAKDTSARAGHELRWAGLKAYLEGGRAFPDVTLLALKMRATDALSQTAARSLNCIVTRKLAIWSPEGGWSEPAVTRSIAWAFADVAKAAYGAHLPDVRIDRNALYALDLLWRARGDTFDGVFDHKTTVWEGLTKVARCGRAVPYLQGGILRIVRDEARAVPVALFGPRSMVKGSLKVHYVMPGIETADAVTVGYFDARTWKSNEATVHLEDSAGDQPVKVTLFGCTDERQAKREGFYMAAANRYRRCIVSFCCEYEGLIPTYGNLISITHDMPRWGQGGEILAYEGNILTTSEPLKWKRGASHVLTLRKRDGSVSGPWAVERGAERNHVLLSQPLDMVPYTGARQERTHYAFGPCDAWGVRARVLAIKPRGEYMEITAVIEHEAVHREYI